MGEAPEFIETVFGSPFPKGQRVELWNLHTHRVDSIALPDAVNAIIPRQPRDTYIAAGYAGKKPTKGRTAAVAVTGIPGFWLDLDVNGGPDEKRGAMASREDAVDLACHFHHPTVLVNSGYGVHAWWVFDVPWIFADDLDRRRAARAVQLWQEAHREAAAPAKLDSTHDLARLMRLPGTVNGKGGAEVPVEIIRTDAGERWPVAELLALVGATESHSKPPTPRAGRDVPSATPLSFLDAPSGASDGELTLDPMARPPQAKFEALLEVSIEFAQTWRRDRPDRKTKDWSHSEWDYSLGSQAAHAGWTRQEVADLLMAFRHNWDPTGDKAKRADYIPRTVQRIFDTVRSSETRREIDEMEAREQARADEQAHHVTQLAALEGRADAGEDVSMEAMEQFNRVLASGQEVAPRVVSIVQTSEDPNSARYTLTFADSRDLTIPPATLAQPRLFATSVMAATGHVMNVPKASYWTAAIRVLLKCRVVYQVDETSTRTTIAEAIESYCSHAHPKREDPVVQEGSPFWEGEQVRFTLSGLMSWMGRRPGASVSRGDLGAALRSLGWKAAPVTYRSNRGQVTSKSYYELQTAQVQGKTESA